MNNIIRVDKNYQNLSDALLNLGCAIFAMYPDHAEDIKVVLPANMHRELFGLAKGFYEVKVCGPFGMFKVLSDEGKF